MDKISNESEISYFIRWFETIFIEMSKFTKYNSFFENFTRHEVSRVTPGSGVTSTPSFNEIFSFFKISFSLFAAFFVTVHFYFPVSILVISCILCKCSNTSKEHLLTKCSFNHNPWYVLQGRLKCEVLCWHNICKDISLFRLNYDGG